jgi:hypothetical protein
MKRHSLRWRSIIYFAILIMLVSAGCSGTVTAEVTQTVSPSSTPEKLRLINGELDACQMISLTEVESVVGIKVVSELRFSMGGSIFCKYTSVYDDRLVFMTFVTTDTTLKKVNDTSSPVETYEIYKEIILKQPTIYKVEDIESFGDQAFFKEGSFLEINVLNNNIFYQFTTQAHGGIGHDALMELAQIVLQRMP